MQNALVSLAISVAVVFAYEMLFRAENVGQPIAVVNYDSILDKLGAAATTDSVNAATYELQQNATKLAAAGFVVIDARVLVSYPAESEVPVVVDAPEVTSDAQVSGSIVDPDAFYEK